MHLREIFRNCIESEEYKFETEFETLFFRNENNTRYYNELKNLTRVVKKSFYEDVSKWTGQDGYNQPYFFLPSHVCEQIDNFCIDFFEEEPCGTISIDIIDQLICDFNNSEGSISPENCSSSFFIVKDGIENNDPNEILIGLKEKVTKNTETITVLKGDIGEGFGLFYQSKNFNKPMPKFKHVSFWKKKNSKLKDFKEISNNFKLLKGE